MNSLSLKHWIKNNNNPFIKSLFYFLKTIHCGDLMGLYYLYKPIYPLYSFIVNTLQTVARIFLWTPFFKTRVLSSGKNLYLYGGLPYISGSLDISYGNGCRISGKTTFSARTSSTPNPQLIIGDNVDIGWMTTIAVGHKVIIGNNVRIASQAFIAGYPGHPINAIERAQGLADKEEQVGNIIINDDVWIATGVSIMQGVSIGKRSIIAAGSVVTKNIPEDVIAAGVPAKVIKSIKDINSTNIKQIHQEQI